MTLVALSSCSVGQVCDGSAAVAYQSVDHAEDHEPHYVAQQPHGDSWVAITPTCEAYAYRRQRGEVEAWAPVFGGALDPDEAADFAHALGVPRLFSSREPALTGKGVEAKAVFHHFRWGDATAICQGCSQRGWKAVDAGRELRAFVAEHSEPFEAESWTITVSSGTAQGVELPWGANEPPTTYADQGSFVVSRDDDPWFSEAVATMQARDIVSHDASIQAAFDGVSYAVYIRPTLPAEVEALLFDLGEDSYP